MKQAEAENRQVTVISLDAMFARLLEREADGADPGELTRELEKLALAELAA